MTMGPEPRMRILQMSVRLGIYLVDSVIFLTLSSRPSRMIRSANHPARGGTCCSLVLVIPFAPANSRSLDCEDRPLRGRSSSLGMTEVTNVYLLWHTWKHAFQSSSD